MDLRSSVDDVGAALAELAAARRAIEVRIGGEVLLGRPDRRADAAGRAGHRAAAGHRRVAADPVDDPLGRLLGRYARTHGPFVAAEPAARFGLGIAVVTDALRRLTGVRPAGRGRVPAAGVDRGPRWRRGRRPEFVDAEVLRLLRRRSLAALRAEVEPVEKQALARFLPAWNGIGVLRGSDALRGTDGLLRAVEQLAGAVVPASALESLILPARVAGYTPAMLDELTTAGEVLWTGHGSLAGDDGWIALHLAETAPLTIPLPDADAVVPDGELHRAILRGAGRRWRVLLPAAGRRGGRVLAAELARRRRSPPGAAASTTSRGRGRAVGPGVRRAGHQRHAGPAAGQAGRRADHPPARRPAPRARMRGPSGLALLSAGRSPAARRRATRRDRYAGARCRRRWWAGGRWCRRSRPTRRCGPTPPPRCCSTGTASSPAVRWSPRAPSAGSPGSTGCWPRWRRPAGSAAAISSKVSGPRSSPPPVRSTGCGRSRPDPIEDVNVPDGLVLAAADPANPYGAACPGPVRRWLPVRPAGGRRTGARSSSAKAADRHRPARPGAAR